MNIYVELIGYMGSALVAVAMLMTSVKKLRIINMIGSLIFMVYAIIIRSYPTAALNLFLVIINLVNIIKLIKLSRNFSVVKCYKDESLIQLFLKNNYDDIHKFFPEFKMDDSHLATYLVFGDNAPVGILIGEESDGGEFVIELDYTIPAYRDFSVGKFLYEYLPQEIDAAKLVFKQKAEYHEKYLLKMGFTYENNMYVKQISTDK